MDENLETFVRLLLRNIIDIVSVIVQVQDQSHTKLLRRWLHYKIYVALYTKTL